MPIFIANSLASPYFLDPWTLSDATFNFTEKAHDRACHGAADHLPARSTCRSPRSSRWPRRRWAWRRSSASTRRGWSLIGLAVGLACGAFNGLLVTRLGLPSIVVTIGTMSLFRGIAFIILGDQAFKGYPASFAFFGQGYVWWVFSFEFVLFLALRDRLLRSLLHLTSFGRASSPSATTRRRRSSPASGSARIKFILFCLTGLMSGIASVLPDLAARLDPAVDRARLGARHR